MDKTFEQKWVLIWFHTRDQNVATTGQRESGNRAKTAAGCITVSCNIQCIYSIQCLQKKENRADTYERLTPRTIRSMHAFLWTTDRVSSKYLSKQALFYLSNSFLSLLNAFSF